MIITIAIPAYNKHDTISKAIESCISQDFSQSYEIIIVDNCSTDGTFEIAQSYQNEERNIRVYQNEANLGMWGNHNRCLELAKGDYVVYCHTDDIFKPYALTQVFERLEFRKFPMQYMLWGHSMFNDYKTQLDRYHWNTNEIIAGSNAYKIFVDSGLAPSGVCYSRKSFLEAGGFINDTKIILPNSDSTTMIKLAFLGFQFEMMDALFFQRTESSSGHLCKKRRAERKEIDTYMCTLMQNHFSERELFQIINESINKSFLMASYLVSLSYLRGKSRRICVKKVLKNPTIIRNKNYRKVFLKLFCRFA
jgi:glycosyltransferase involved in cell wall biosynthesis